MYDKISTNRVKEYLKTNNYLNDASKFIDDQTTKEQIYYPNNKSNGFSSHKDQNLAMADNEYNELLGHYFKEKGVFDRDPNEKNSK